MAHPEAETHQASVDAAETSTFSRAFTGIHARLIADIHITPVFRALLKDYDVLSEQQVIECKNVRGDDGSDNNTPQVEKMLELLIMRPNSMFARFCRVLDETKQQHISQLLKDNLYGNDRRTVAEAEIDGEFRVTNKDDGSFVRSVLGVAYLNDKFFVISLLSPVIRIFSIQRPYSEILPSIQIRGLKQPRDIASCGNLQRIYICDFDTKYVWKVVSKNNDYRSDCFVKTEGPPFTLSVRNSNIVVVCALFRQIVKYDPDGKELQRITVPEIPWHAIESHDGTYIVCWKSSEDPQKTVVCELDSDGFVRPGFKNDSVELDPHHMTWAAGSVLVAGVKDGQHKVLLLKRSLQFDRFLHSEQHSVHGSIHLLFVDKPEPRLIVAAGQKLTFYKLLLTET